MAFWKNIANIFAARRKKQPDRDTVQFPRLQYYGQFYNQRAHQKPMPANLRYFSRTIYARRGIKALTDPVTLLDWEITPCKGVDISPELERQIAIVTECFKRPNNDDSFSSLLQKMIEDYCIFGAGVLEQQLGNHDIRPLFLYPVDAQSIQIYPDWDGSRTQPRYLQTIGYSNVGLVEGVDLRNDEIVYILSNPSNETPYGFGPIEIAFASISRLLGVETYAGNITSNAIPQTLLYMGNYNDNELRAFRHYWSNQIEGQGQLPITSGDAEPKAIKLHAGNDEALFLKYQEFLIRTLSTAFSLSPQNFSIQGDTNRSTAEVAEDRDWDQAIKPLAALFAEYFTRRIIHAKLGFYQIEFKFVGLDREDELATAQIAEIYFKNNMITPDEQREKLGMPPMENDWGDKTFADMQIAISAARGIKALDDPDIAPKINPTKAQETKNASQSSD